MFTSEYVQTKINSGTFRYMAIYSATNKSIVIDSVEGDPKVLESAWNEFETNCLSGKYIIELFTEDNMKSGKKDAFGSRKTIYWEKRSSGPEPGLSGQNHDRIEADRIRNELHELKFEMKMKEIEDGRTSQTYAMLEKIFFALNKQAPGPQIAAPAPAPKQQGPAEETPPEEMAAFAQQFEEWQKHDPELLNTIQALSNLAKKEPDQYAMYRGMLIDSAKSQENG